MHKIAFVLACLACVGHGRQSSQFDDRQLSAEDLPVQQLATLLMALTPEAQFNPSVPGMRNPVQHGITTGSRPTALASRNRFGPRAAEARMDGAVAVAPEQTQQEEEKKEEKEEKKESEVAFGKPMVIGLTHNTASVEMREKLAIPETGWNEASAKLMAFDSVDEAAILSTCNRFEVYIVAKDFDAAERDVLSFLVDKSGMAEEKIRPNLFMQWDKEATRHLLRVSSGLDSLVVGEAHILSQVKACYTHAMAPESENEPAGSAKQVLSRLLQTSIATGKAVRTETAIGEGAVSISSAAVELAALKSRTVLGRPLPDLQVAVVGAGVMSRALLMNLARYGLTKVVLLNRSPPRAEALKEEFKADLNVEIKLMDEFWPAIDKMDLVFTATSSVECIITKEKLEAGVWADEAQKLMLIDIAVPRNVAADCNDLPNVVSYNVDDLKEVVAANQAKRATAIQEAEDFLETELKNFESWQESLQYTVPYIPLMSELQAKHESWRAAELAEVEDEFAGLTEVQQGIIRETTKGAIKSCMGMTMVYLRSDIRDGSKASVNQIKDIMGLSPPPHHLEASSDASEQYAEVISGLEQKFERCAASKIKGIKKTGPKSLPDESKQVLEGALRRLMDKIKHDPISYLQSDLPEGTKPTVEQVRAIFALKQ